MPTLEVTTKSAQQVWKSPDGQRTISEVILDYQGQAFKAKTYSGQIATPGWTGTVVTEEKSGRNGPETFVKQPPKDNPGFGSTGGGSSKSGYTPRDDDAIKAQFAIKTAANWCANLGLTEITDVESVAHDFFAMVERVKAGEVTVASSVKEVFGDDVVVEDVSSEPLNLSDLPDLG